MINYEEKYPICGALKSPDDDRDYTMGQIVMKAVRLPEKHIVQVPAIIADQKNVASCCACTLAQIKHCQEYQETGDTNMFSAAYIYANRKDTDYQGEGMFPREALSNLVEYGTCYNEDFPWYATYEYAQTKDLYSSNKNVLDKKAKPYRASSYYRLNTLEDVKTALYVTNQYVQICYDVYKCLYHPNSATGIVEYNEEKRGKCYGGHSMTCVAYDDTKRCLGIVNSWNIDYGVGIEGVANGGCVWIPYEYEFGEAWCVIDAKTEKEIIRNYQ